MKAALIAVPLLPLAAALACWALPRSSRVAGFLAVAAPLLALALLWALPGGLQVSTTWLSVGGLEATIGLRCDGLARVLALLVAAIAAAVNLYAIAYMADDPRRGRFFAWMAAFAGTMLALVLADSLLLLFVAWELVGVISFALIAFHHREREARRAAHRAFLVTRAGDLAFLFALAVVMATTGTTDLDALSVVEGEAALYAVAFGLLVAAIAKSAQLPLSSWLPGAMTAPTPVSALLHSATMVAAGVFLVARTWPVFVQVASAQVLLTWIGAVTALAAALVATGSRDLKRLLAWSTISQLGEMMLVLGLASPAAAIFHLVTHGFFKAALFAVAGAIDQRAGARKLGELGGLVGRAPWLASSFAVAGLALAAVPPFAGYYSGEALLGAATAAHPMWAAVLCANLFLAGVYVSRAFAGVFLSWPDAPRPELAPPRAFALAGLAPLAAGAAVAGLALRTPLEHALFFASPPSPSHVWSFVAIAGSVLGIGLGTVRVLRRGPVPTFGVSLGVLERATEQAVALPARATMALGAAIRPIEAGLDAVARTTTRLITTASRAFTASDAALDALARTTTRAITTSSRAFTASDAGLDAAARAGADATLELAGGVDRAERDGLGAGLDRAAAALGRAGDALRSLQTGRIYHYAMGLFVWSLVAGLIAVFLWS